MIELPKRLLDLLIEKERTLVVELPPPEPGYRAWAKIAVLRLFANPWHREDPDALAFGVYKYEIDQESVQRELDDEDGHEPLVLPYRNEESLKTRDLSEALAFAARFEPDFTRWGTRDDHPDMPR